MKWYGSTLGCGTALAVLLTLVQAQPEDCAFMSLIGQYADVVAVVDIKEPTCSPTDDDTSSLQTALFGWTLVPSSDANTRVYSQPPKAVNVTLDEDGRMTFIYNNMSQVPENVGMHIQVPANQLERVEMEGLGTSLFVDEGFSIFHTISVSGVDNIVQAALGQEREGRIEIESANARVTVKAGALGSTLSVPGTSNVIEVMGTVVGGSLGGAQNVLKVEGEIQSLMVSGSSQRITVSSNTACANVVDNVADGTTTCLVNETLEVTMSPDIPCTISGVEKNCRLNNAETCVCDIRGSTSAGSLRVGRPWAAVMAVVVMGIMVMV